jgi:hypothetical protein
MLEAAPHSRDQSRPGQPNLHIQSPERPPPATAMPEDSFPRRFFRRRLPVPSGLPVLQSSVGKVSCRGKSEW